jgi:hypothetical protein
MSQPDRAMTSTLFTDGEIHRWSIAGGSQAERASGCTAAGSSGGTATKCA